MSLQPDDPRLTAYALGELDDPADREAVMAAVRADPELQLAVEDIRKTAQQLQQALAEDTAPGLSRAEKAALTGTAAGSADDDAPGVLSQRQRQRLPSQSRRRSRKLVSFPVIITAAAAAVLVLMLTVQNWLEGPLGPVLAENSPPPDTEETPQEPVAEVESDLAGAVKVTTKPGDPTLRKGPRMERAAAAPAVDELVAATETQAPDVGLLAPLNVIVTGSEVFDEAITFDPDVLRPEWGTLGGLGDQLAEATKAQRPVVEPGSDGAPTMIASSFASPPGVGASIMLDAEEDRLLAPDNDAALALGVRRRAPGEVGTGGIVAVVPQPAAVPTPNLEVAAVATTPRNFVGTSTGAMPLQEQTLDLAEVTSVAPTTVTNRVGLNNGSYRYAASELTPALKGQRVNVNFNLLETDLSAERASESLLRLYAGAGARDDTAAFDSFAPPPSPPSVPLQSVPEVIRSMQAQGIPVQLGPVQVQGTVLEVLPGFVNVNLDLQGLDRPVPVQLPLSQVVWVDAPRPLPDRAASAVSAEATPDTVRARVDSGDAAEAEADSGEAAEEVAPGP